ncbi:MAG TPA: tRNA 2-thiouridine(34) synthase MnmA [Candidatus Binatia bacterium]|nr:tRNA 2-thiouridine(34) synthase MnmA [Candidatus Binatia bacterium]
MPLYSFSPLPLRPTVVSSPVMQPGMKKITVAMSGGVDSSVAAALLVREGHEVSGAFMKNWSDEADPCTGECAWKQERQDALRVAATLGIPFETYDFEDDYRREVVDYMVREYAAGRTPNPDVLCNSKVKFHLFLRRALENGADMIATGHYARVEDGALLAGVDANKDQSYFLHRLTKEQLSRTLFPVGHLPKPEVRRLAKEFGLPTAEKKDSQGICFIGKVDLANFLGAKIAARTGPIVTTDGHVVGRHPGAVPFTIGQRHGLGVGGGAPYFVVDKDVARNTVVVARDQAELDASALVANEAQWISGAAPPLPLACKARIRYRQPLQDCTVTATATGLHVDFARPQRAISPGQFIVFYQEDRCLGGAVIERAENRGQR